MTNTYMNTVTTKMLLDLHTEEVVGELFDISEAGMMLISQKPIPSNRVYHFKVPTAGEDVLFRARSVWCTQRENSPEFEAGFQLMIADRLGLYKMKQMLRTLIER